MELEIWCGVENLCSFDPECLALSLLIASNGLDIAIKQTNYTLDGKLPALTILGEKGHKGKIRGFVEIVDYLKQQMLIQYSSYDTCLQFYADKLTTLSLWLLFESPRNYAKVTRPTISSAVPFPMQYNLTIDLQRQVQQRSQGLGVVAIAPVEKQPGLNKTHEKMLEQSQTRVAALKSTQRTSQVVKAAQLVYAQLAQLQPSDLEPGSPAYCLVAANILIQTLELPDPVFRSTILEQAPKLAATAEWARAQEPIADSENTYTLPNYLGWRIQSIRSVWSWPPSFSWA